MKPDKSTEYRAKLLELLPTDGSTMSNLTLLSKLQAVVTDDEINQTDYWTIRQPLIDEGSIAVGRGYGGTVKKVVSPEPIVTAAVPEVPSISGETALYEPFQKSIESFTKAEGLDNVVFVKTAMQGRRNTGGKWTRPDLTLIAVRTFEFIPGKHLEVISFEVKPDIGSALEGVFEALAHSAFAHRSYLAIKTETGQASEPNQDLERISSECARHGVGLYTFTNAGDFNSFELQQDALRRNPDPAKVNAFLATQVDSETKSRVRAMVR